MVRTLFSPFRAINNFSKTKPGFYLGFFLLGFWVFLCLSPTSAIAQDNLFNFDQSPASVSGAMRDAFDNIWESEFTADSPIFNGLSVLIILFGLGSFILSCMEEIKQVIGQGKPLSVEFLFWIVLVLVLSPLPTQIALANSARFIVNQPNIQMLERTQFQQVFREAQARDSYATNIAPSIQQCETLVADQQIECLRPVVERARALNQSHQNAFGLPEWLQRWQQRIGQLGDTLTNPDLNISQRAGGALWTIFYPQWQAIIHVFLTGWMMAFQALLEIALLTTAFLFPLAIAGSFLPVPAKPIYMIVEGFFTIGLTKIAFNMMVGLSSSASVNMGIDAPNLWFPIFNAFIAPVTATALAGMGGILVWRSIVAAGEAGIGSVVTALKLGIGKFA